MESGPVERTEREQLEAAIARIEAERAVLGDAAADVAVAALRARLQAVGPAADTVAPAAHEPRLRLVSVLFLDVVGSTALSTHLDPEDLHAVLDTALARFTAIVASHRGKVLQYAGDSVLAAFGAEGAREDDAERAVRAGLDLLAEGRRQGTRVEAEHGLAGFDVRVGVHTGRVLLGSGVDEERSIRGTAVHLAARMEQTAPVGGLRISRETHEHVRGLFDVEHPPPLAIKGRDEPVDTFLVLKARPRAQDSIARGIAGVATRMVGRDAELAILQDAVAALQTGPPGMARVTVIGDAGLGKSRLKRELLRWAEAQPTRCRVLEGRAHPLSEHRPYGVLRDVVARALGIADSDDAQAARAKITAALVPRFAATDGLALAEAHAHLLGHLIGVDFAESPHVHGILDDARQIRARGFLAATRWLSEAAREQPLLLVLDDLHWADEGSLDFLEQLAQGLAESPVLLMALARPTLDERRPNWGRSIGAARRIDLAPLPAETSRDLADDLLQRMPVRTELLRDLLTARAEGNPYFMEELVRMLVDAGAIAVDGDADGERWRVVPERLLAAQVPSTLVGVLQARLDSLAPADLGALQRASVVGHVFWDDALLALDPGAGPALERLERRFLITPHAASAFEGRREYAFRHHMLHEVTYDTLLKPVKREAHGRVARWLAAQPGATHLHLVAEHHERAGERAEACTWFTRAAESASERYANEAMLHAVGRGLALAEAGDHDIRWRLLTQRSSYLASQSDRARHWEDLAALQALADTTGHPVRQAEVAMRRASALNMMGDFRRAEADARRAIELARQAGAGAVGLRAHYHLATSFAKRGDHAAAAPVAEAGWALARSVGDRPAQARLLNVLGLVAAMRGDPVASLGYTEQTVALARELGDRSQECSAVNNLAMCCLHLGDHEAARRHLDDCLQLTRAVQQRYVEANVRLNLSMLARREGDYAAGAVHAARAIALGALGALRQVEASGHSAAGDAALGLGQLDAAETSFERARRIFEEMNTPNLAMEPIAGLARVALARGDTTEALRRVDPVLAHLDAHGSFDGGDEPLRVYLTCHEVLRRAGDDRAPRLLEAARTELRTQAERIRDPARRESFLQRIPHHRAILVAALSRAL